MPLDHISGLPIWPSLLVKLNLAGYGPYDVPEHYPFCVDAIIILFFVLTCTQGIFFKYYFIVFDISFESTFCIFLPF